MNAGRKRFFYRLLILLFLLLLPGCTGVPEGVETVTGIEFKRYLGKWYEIARLDHSFERGLHRVTADYSLRDDGGVRVINRGYDVKKKEWQEAEGRAYFVESSRVGRLKVSFFGPFFGGYNIIDLDKERYSYALVCGYNRNYLWILSRAPALDPATTERLVTKARTLGFATENLIFPVQGE